jgi:UDPglucose 6-dehydrogenase
MMPRHVSGVLRELLYRAGVPADEGRVLFLGWSYKAGVGDARETPADPLAESLIETGVSVSTWDPYLSAEDIPNGIEVIDDIDSASDFDMVVLATAHPECLELDWQGLCGRMRTPILYDGRRVLDLEAMQAMGWKSNAVGSPMQY